VFDRWYTARRRDFRHLETGGKPFLYTVAADPGERRTVAAEYPGIFQQLQRELRERLTPAVAAGFPGA